ncbi:MAG: aminotransferase class I/II-fold pyridoxal phosphate-dependent enzyme [Nitrospiraceae bacterium]
MYTAARELRRPVSRLIDFSASINPLGPSPRVLKALGQLRTALVHYPDADCVDLRCLLAARWHCSIDQLVVGNGSNELIHLLPLALRIRHAWIIGPTFGEYAAALTAAGARTTCINATSAQRFQPPLALLRRELRETSRSRRPDAIVICNPNSPTGQSVSREALLQVARLAARAGIWCIVDEAFADYCEAISLLNVRSPIERRTAWPVTTVVLRSLTKFHALPGLRVGYVIASPTVCARIRAQQVTWSVNAVAQQAALAALGDRAHARRSLDVMSRWRKRMAAALNAIPGCTVFPSTANFLWMELPETVDVRRVIAELRTKGLLVRDGTGFGPDCERCIRVAVKKPADQDRLLTHLRRALKTQATG